MQDFPRPARRRRPPAAATPAGAGSDPGAGAAAAASPAAASAGRAYRGQALADRMAQRRTRFIEAGIAVFGTQGLRGATVRGLCTKAALTDRYFYESFANPTALLQAVYDTLMDRLHSALQRADAAPQAGWVARVQAGYGVWFDMVSDPCVARIVLAEVLGVSPEVDAQYTRRMNEFAELTTAPMLAALPRDRLPPAQRALVGHALVGAAVQVARAWVAGGYRLPQATVVRSCVLVATGTLRALAADMPDDRDGPG